MENEPKILICFYNIQIYLLFQAYIQCFLIIYHKNYVLHHKIIYEAYNHDSYDKYLEVTH